MLASARELLADTGVTVSLDGLGMEDVIAHAEVPRSSVYRIWPYRGDFIDDLLCHLAGPDWFGDVLDPKSIEIGTEVVLSNAHRIGTVEGRREVLLEAVRLAVTHNLDVVAESPERPVFTALVSALPTLRGAESRRRIPEALQESEVRLLSTLGQVYGTIATMLGYRLRRPEYTWVHLACTGAALVEGMALRARIAWATQHVEPTGDGLPWTLTGVVDKPLPGPGLDGTTVEWPLVALAFAGLLDTFCEPDPDYVPPDIQSADAPAADAPPADA